jgi:DNA (cytosine-5)-methyltransferase 1
MTVSQRNLFKKPQPGVSGNWQGRGLRGVGLFAGIGGIELGLHRAGHSTEMFCEIDQAATEVLRARFDGIEIREDVTQLRSLPRGIDILTAGFPCQDLSQAGQTIGIDGERSGLIGEVFRLLRRQRVPLVLLENVSFMLQLQKGRALEKIVATFEELGYSWAYRVLDSRFTGIPQRRERVFLVAARDADPRRILLSEDASEPDDLSRRDWWEAPCGFYWTEGLRGLGWAFNSIPTLKGGSTIGIPSPPAIIFPDAAIVTPDVRDAERLQGFDPDWTQPAESVAKRGHRWKLVGNAVTVDVAQWLGSRLRDPSDYDDSTDSPIDPGSPWPRAAWGIGGQRFRSSVSAWPIRLPRPDLDEFLRFPTSRLSTKAAAGFKERAERSSLRFPPRFLEAIDQHIRAAT